jgi:hypothetical protein
VTRTQKNIVAVVALLVGIGADQMIDLQVGMVGHALVLLVAGGPVVLLFGAYFRRRRARGSEQSHHR